MSLAASHTNPASRLYLDHYPIYHLLLSQRLGKPVQRIADDTVDAFDAGGGQGFDNQFGDVSIHKLWTSLSVSKK